MLDISQIHLELYSLNRSIEVFLNIDTYGSSVIITPIILFTNNLMRLLVPCFESWIVEGLKNQRSLFRKEVK